MCPQPPLAVAVALLLLLPAQPKPVRLERPVSARCHIKVACPIGRGHLGERDGARLLGLLRSCRPGRHTPSSGASAEATFADYPSAPTAPQCALPVAPSRAPAAPRPLRDRPPPRPRPRQRPRHGPCPRTEGNPLQSSSEPDVPSLRSGIRPAPRNVVSGVL